MLIIKLIFHYQIRLKRVFLFFKNEREHKNSWFVFNFFFLENKKENKRGESKK